MQRGRDEFTGVGIWFFAQKAPCFCREQCRISVEPNELFGKYLPLIMVDYFLNKSIVHSGSAEPCQYIM